MRVGIVKIGSKQGIRIPKPILKQVGDSGDQADWAMQGKTGIILDYVAYFVESNYHILTNVRSFNSNLKVFYPPVGRQEPCFESAKKAVADFKSHGLNVEFASFLCRNEWQVWCKSFNNFAYGVS